MSFITKRDRVFNEYDLFDLPARNEGKLKAYSSCTDARAWSHFCSDKSEHLVDIIKRNNEICRPKYVPTDVIVNTLMGAKNAEIGRLKRKIEEFEQMIAAYDQLELTSDQKCEIVNAHAAIKAANKELDEMCLDLNMSGYTEGIDSEAFETGKSRGDEVSRLTIETEKSRGDEWDKEPVNVEAKSNQTFTRCVCEVGTIAVDPRIEELEEAIIRKDAKLNAMRNTIAVMENDVCEPYCIYANIYTALEKIFGILCQNKKYKDYLNLLATEKDTRYIDLKGKIIFKIKVLEKFCVALTAPCNQDNTVMPQCCPCQSTTIVAHVETAFAFDSTKSKQPSLDIKRAQLIADIMDNDEMKEILDKESNEKLSEDNYQISNYSIDAENLNRLKTLQENYDDLLTCYDNLKYERDSMVTRCQKLSDLENECECLQDRLREYDQLWKENAYYKKRSEDLDKLKETYYILLEETTNMETRLKAESEINKIKSDNLNELREENIALDKKLHEMSLEFEKERNSLSYRLKEYECKIMCQEQQIKSLSSQIESLLVQGSNKVPTNEEVTQTMELINEIESQKEQIKNLTHACYCNEEEKNIIQDEFEKKLEVINELKMELELWKGKYDEKCHNCEFLKDYADQCQTKLKEVDQANKQLAQNMDDQKNAVDNLYDMLKKKSQEISNLNEQIDTKNEEIKNLLLKIQNTEKLYNNSIESFQNEQKLAINLLYLDRRESFGQIPRIHDYKDVYQELYSEECKKTVNQHESESSSKTSNFLNEIEFIRKENSSAIRALKESNSQYKKSIELIQTESSILKTKLENFEQLTREFDDLQHSHKKLSNEKESLENLVYKQSHDLINLKDSFQVEKKKSGDLLANLQNIETEKKEFAINKEKQITELLATVENLKIDNDRLLKESKRIVDLEQKLLSLKKEYDNIFSEKSFLQQAFDNKTKEFNNLFNEFQEQINVNKVLNTNLEMLKMSEKSKSDEILNLRNENENIKMNLDAMTKENVTTTDKLNYYLDMESKFIELSQNYDKMDTEKKELQKHLENERAVLNKIEVENYQIKTHNDELLKALELAQKELLSEASSSHSIYNNLKAEVEILKNGKHLDLEKIKCLLEKLDNKEDIIAKLTEEKMDKDIKISELRNHIKELQNEIRTLHENLDTVIETGEDISVNSFEKIDSSIKKIEAHYSKATHNIKMELSKLKEENSLLENQKMKEGFTNKEKYLLRIRDLENEREAISEEVKKLEIKITGKSDLKSLKCKDFIKSINNISKCFDERNASLEETLVNVRNSYQLLKSKAEEAKTIAECEKQKILDEKEKEKLDRKKVQNRLETLQNQLKEQETKYEEVVKDLEGQINNQKLVFENYIKANKEHIENLKGDIHLLQSEYETSKIKIDELQKDASVLSEKNSNYKKLVKEFENELHKKSTEIEKMRNKIDLFQNKVTRDIGFQVAVYKNEVDGVVQTESEYLDKLFTKQSKGLSNSNVDDVREISNKISDTIDQETHKKHKNTLDQKQVNEFQILTANIEPGLGFVRNAYLNYKIKRLKPSAVEQYSFSSLSSLIPTSNAEKLDQQVSSDNKPNVTEIRNENNKNDSLYVPNEIDYDFDIKNNEGYNETLNSDRNDTYLVVNHDRSIEHLIVGNDFPNNDTIVYQDTKNNIFSDVSPISTDKDLFVIFTDSDNTNSDRLSLISEKDTDVPTFTSNKGLKDDNHIYNKSKHNKDNVKQKLKIKLPVINIENLSIETTSIENKKSIDSYSSATNPSPQNGSYSETFGKSKASIYNRTSLITTSLDDNDSDNVLPSPEKRNGILMRELSDKKIDLERDFDKSKTNANQIDTNTKNSNGKNNKNTKYIKHRQTHSLDYSKRESGLGTVNSIYPDKASSMSTNELFQVPYSSIKNKFERVAKTESRQIHDEIHGRNKILRKSKSEETFGSNSDLNQSEHYNSNSEHYKSVANDNTEISNIAKQRTDRSILVKLDSIEEYELKVQRLTEKLEMVEKDYKKKIEAIKIQYDTNVKSIINEHIQGVSSIQSLHEETLHDMKKIRDTEIENLRSMSIEAMHKAEKLERENNNLRLKLKGNKLQEIGEETSKLYAHESKRRRHRPHDAKTLTKTEIEAFNVKPNRKAHGPCTCSLDINVSDTIRNIFNQVDADKRQTAENAYLKYIAKKLHNSNMEKLDAQELSFLHLKICRLWKTKLHKEEVFQMKIDSLENDIMKKHRKTQNHLSKLDRQVAEERLRLQQVRETVCCSRRDDIRDHSLTFSLLQPNFDAEKEVCDYTNYKIKEEERRSAGDLMLDKSKACEQPILKLEQIEALKAQLSDDQQEAKKLEDTPMRLRKSNEKHRRHYKK